MCVYNPSNLDGASTKLLFLDDAVDGLLWAVTEPATGLICSCLPVMRPLLVKVKKKYGSSTASSGWTPFCGDDTTAINETRRNAYSTKASMQSGSQTQADHPMDPLPPVEISSRI